MVTVDISKLKPIQMVNKAWGIEWWLTNTDKYCAKILFLNRGFRCSLHRHDIKQEDFLILEGKVRLEQRDVRGYPFDEILLPGDARTIRSRTLHRFSPIGGNAIILEISTQHSDDDVFRIEESGPIPK